MTKIKVVNWLKRIQKDLVMIWLFVFFTFVGFVLGLLYCIIALGLNPFTYHIPQPLAVFLVICIAILLLTGYYLLYLLKYKLNESEKEIKDNGFIPIEVKDNEKN